MAQNRGRGPGRLDAPAKKRWSEPEPVGELLPRVLSEMGLDAASESAHLMRCWDAALGPELAPHCRPQGIQRGIAHATVADSAWMQRIQMQKPAILARLREALRAAGAEGVVDDLRLRIGAERRD